MKGQISKPSTDAVYFAFNHVEGGRNVTFQNGTSDTITVEVTNQNIQRTGLSGATWSTPANGATTIPVDAVKGIIGPYAFVRLSGDGIGAIYYAYTSKDDGIIFTPLELFQGGEQGVWYDPSDLTTLYQDAAGTTPVTSAGDPVGLMLDKSGNGNHATQATSAARPTYQTDGTYHWLEGDGVDDGLIVPSIQFSVDWSACAAFFVNGQDQSVMDADTTTIRQAQILRTVDSNLGVVGFDESGAGNVVRSTQNILSTKIVGSSSMNDGSLSLFLDSSEADQTTVINPAAKNISVTLFYKASGASQRMSGRIFGAVLLASRSATNTERQKTEQWLANKAGVTL